MWTALSLIASRHPTPPQAGPTDPSIDPAARYFALRAWRAEARGSHGEAERAWRWVDRLDGSAHARRHQADAHTRLGLDAASHYRAALALDPTNTEATLGLALASDGPLGPLLERYACRIATSSHPERTAAEALCVR